MLKFLSFSLFLFTVSANADEFEIASRMADSGADALALSYLESHAPAKPDEKWKNLELALLSKSGKYEKALDVANQLPFSQKTADIAISAAFSRSKPAIARDWLARLIWNGNLPKAGLRQARGSVIRTYVMEKDGKDAYYAMLRFDQDYHPLSKTEAHEFVSGLSSLGMAKDAIPWLVFLDENDEAKIGAELENGLISPDEAVSKANGNPEILLQAGKLKQDPSLEIEAEEALLSAGKISADALWKRYLDNAISYSNKYALLQGDYGSWPDAIAKIPDPYARRSLLAYLSEKDPKASVLLVGSLEDEPKVAAALLKAGKAGNASTLLQYLKEEKALDAKKANLVIRIAEGLKKDEEKTVLSALLAAAPTASKQSIMMKLGKCSENPEEAAAWYFQAFLLSPKPDEISRQAKLDLISSLREAGFFDDAKALEK